MDRLNSGDDREEMRLGKRVPSSAADPRNLIGRLIGMRGAGILPLLLLLFLWVVAGTVGYMVIEGYSAWDAIYMTVITLSTVGYQEVHPLSTAGQVFTSGLILVGLGTVFYAFTSIGQMVVEGELADMLGRRRMRQELTALEDHYIVCGFGRTSRPVVAGLEQENEAFCVVDIDDEMEEDLNEEGYVYLIGDATEEEVLETAGIERARGLIALLPSDADNLYLTMAAKNMNPNVQVIARVTDERAERNLRRGGADIVVSPYETAGNRVVQAALKPTILEFMELATPRVQLQLSLEEVRVEPDSPLDGHSLAESEIRRRCGVIIVAIKRKDNEMVFNPNPSETIRPGDTLVALGEGEDLDTLERLAATPNR